jgi:Heparan-alpha-glucosaminide N-acetyltransferase, catalytic
MQTTSVITPEMARHGLAKSPSAARFEELDVLKGMLVVGMLVFHAASVATERHPEFLRLQTVLGFLHTAFVLLCGFLCGSYYAAAAQLQRAPARLAERALKTFGLFAVANTLLVLIGFRDWRVWLNAGSSLPSVFNHFVREMDANIAAFVVLYYIAILLALAALFVRSGRPRVAFAVGLLACAAGAAHSTTLWFLTFGMAGMLLGSCRSQLQPLWTLANNYRWLAPLALTGYWMLPLEPNPSVGVSLLRVFLETGLWCWAVLAFYHLLLPKLVRSWVLDLGRETLLAYVGQMFIYQLNWALWAKYIRDPYLYYTASLVACTCLVLLGIQVAARISTRRSPAALAYRLAFH